MYYFAPINKYSNFVYRHLLLKHSADYVFSELINIKEGFINYNDDKLRIIEEDIYRTIFQIGVSSNKEIKLAINYIKNKIKDIREINLNMGCPQSTMKEEKRCGGILFDTTLMAELSATLVKSIPNIIPSVKLRLGTDENNIKIIEYLSILEKIGIKKVYIHARPFKYNYTRPCLINNFKGLIEKYPNMTLIYNGDIDSLQSCNGYSEIMIGRAALSNPLIFEDIKNNVKYREGQYDPLVKDPYLIRKHDVKLSNKKVEVINEFLDYAKKYSLGMRYAKSNLSYLSKGVTDYKTLSKMLSKTTNLEELKEAFNNWIKKY